MRSAATSSPAPSTLRRPFALGALVAGTASAALLVVPATPSVAVPPGGAVSRSNGASVRLSTTSVERGSSIRVSGRNWRSKGSRTTSGAVVTVKLDDRDVLAQFRIRNKRFSGSVRIPGPVSKGRHTLRFLASKPATSIKSKTFRVR